MQNDDGDRHDKRCRFQGVKDPPHVHEKGAPDLHLDANARCDGGQQVSPIGKQREQLRERAICKVTQLAYTIRITLASYSSSDEWTGKFTACPVCLGSSSS